ncbi:hypothetical protein TNCV_479231 [Trichonephila clavipes]|nr:hypothetical protein TNCV_479231 [Trichonephila clavipes]
MPHERHRASFDLDSEFDRERIVPYRDYGLFFRKFGHRVGRNQATVMRIYHCWVHKETTQEDRTSVS